MSCYLCDKHDCRRCGECHQPECTHHQFVPVIQPAGCNCTTSDWSMSIIPPVCDEYAGDGEEYCDTCEHDKECHQPKPEATI